MNFPDELKQYLQPLELERHGHDDTVHRCQSRRLLAQIDFLDQQIAAPNTDKQSRRKSQQARNRLAQAFAKHLDAGIQMNPPMISDSFEEGIRRVWIVLRIVGTPSRKGREKAAEWMTSQGRRWNGDIDELRVTMRKALQRGVHLPDGHFGLRVERTVSIGIWSIDEPPSADYNDGKATSLPIDRSKYPLRIFF